MTHTDRSKGAVLLTRVGSTQDAIAQKLDVSPSIVAHWQVGSRRPGMPNRKLLFETYGIPLESWDEAPSASPLARAVETPEAITAGTAQTVAVRATALEAAADSLMTFVTVEGNATPHERAKVINSLAHTLNNLRRLKGEAMPEGKVLRHPQWVALKEAVLRALARHPAARLDVISALETIEGNSD